MQLLTELLAKQILDHFIEMIQTLRSDGLAASDVKLGMFSPSFLQSKSFPNESDLEDKVKDLFDIPWSAVVVLGCYNYENSSWAEIEANLNTHTLRYINFIQITAQKCNQQLGTDFLSSIFTTWASFVREAIIDELGTPIVDSEDKAWMYLASASTNHQIMANAY